MTGEAHRRTTSARVTLIGGSGVAARPTAVASAILGGEAVVEDERGIPSFSALQAALGVREARSHPGLKAPHEAVYYAFDLLWLDGEDLRARPLEERRSALERVLFDAQPGGHLRLSEEVSGDGQIPLSPTSIPTRELLGSPQ